MADILSKIKNGEDKALISDAIQLCENKFYRASYIMAWLSCAESLKRRFYELGKRDSAAGGVSREIKELEKQHKSVDIKLIDEAFRFNLISDVEKEKLLHFFNMRSVYSHPYEDSPSEIDCKQIIESVIEIVLSRPVLLKEGGISFILKRLTEEKSFLNDSLEEVENYATEIIPHIDPNKYNYICEKYLQFLNGMTKDQYNDVVYKRGVYFIRSFIKKVKLKEIWNNDEFENILYKYKSASLNVFATINIFETLSGKHQSIIINRLEEDLDDNLFLIGYLDKIYVNSLMNSKQAKQYLDKILSLQWNQLNSLGLSMKSMFHRLIKDLKAHSWYVQNPACQYIKNAVLFLCPNVLNDDEFIELGRNILQAFDGGSSMACELLEDISSYHGFPLSLIQGIVEECFYDDNKAVRLKLRNPQLINSIVERSLSTDDKENLFLEISTNIMKNPIKRKWALSDYNNIPDDGFLGRIKPILNQPSAMYPF